MVKKRNTRRRTKHGHYDISLEREAKRIQDMFKQKGFKVPSFREATKLVSHRSKNSRYTFGEMKNALLDDFLENE